MNQRAMDTVFWTAFGVGGVALLALLLVVVNSDYSWEAVGELGVLTGVYITAQTDGERRWCLAVVAAIVAFDVPRVKALLPRATYQNLNDLRGNTTLFVFALEQGGGPASPERLEMVKGLLKAGGIPGYPKGRALAAVATQGYEMNKLLLEAGASPNEREFAGPCPWRRWVARDGQGREQVEMLKLFQEYGASLRIRDFEKSAVAEAVEEESWETALILLEAGAYWKESGLGAKARAALAKYEGREAPEALRKVVLFF